MSQRSPWLDDKPAPDVRELSREELQEVWAANRNSLLSHVAADEYIRRDWIERKPKETTT